MSVIHILIPLANEVVRTNRVFVEIGPNTRRRIDDLHAWVQEELRHDLHVWMVGAGTDAQHESGPTLALLAARYLSEELDVSALMVNYHNAHVWGTAEEIGWAIEEARRCFPGRELCFVFGTQPRHLTRVRCIMWLFHRDVQAMYIPTGYTRQVPWMHEALAYAKLGCLLLGFNRLVLAFRRFRPLRIDRLA